MIDNIKERASDLVGQVIELERIMGKRMLLLHSAVYSSPLNCLAVLPQTLPPSFWLLVSLIQGMNTAFKLFFLASI